MQSYPFHCNYIFSWLCNCTSLGVPCSFFFFGLNNFCLASVVEPAANSCFYKQDILVLSCQNIVLTWSSLLTAIAMTIQLYALPKLLCIWFLKVNFSSQVMEILVFSLQFFLVFPSVLHVCLNSFSVSQVSTAAMPPLFHCGRHNWLSFGFHEDSSEEGCYHPRWHLCVRWRSCDSRVCGLTE